MRSLLVVFALLAGCARTPTIVVTGGVHGNETSGAAALQRLKEAGFITFGPCNPWGVEHRRRGIADGRDLNRLFAVDGVEEVERVREFLREHPPALLLDLHEDGDAPGPYLMQIGPDDDLGERIVAELQDEYEFDPKPAWGPIYGRDGVLKPTATLLKIEEKSGIWSLSFYAWRTYNVTSFTVEVPSGWPMERKIEFHARVAEIARRYRS